MRALLVALGRMGDRYRQVLENRYGDSLELTTVDPKFPTNAGKRHYASISEVPTDIAFELAIDARPNHDRLSLFKAFLERQIPNLIIEKPHAASIAESNEMLALYEAQAKKPRILMPFYERYGDHYLPQTLNQLDAGKLCSIVASSGAIGLGCNGIHLIDLAHHLFQAVPCEVYAHLIPDSVASPRGEQFRDHAGTIVTRYPQGQEFILTMRPDSTVGFNITLIYEHGKIQILEQIEPMMAWYQQPRDTWNDPNYRTHRELAKQPPCTFEKDLINVMMPRALDDLLNDGPYPNFLDGHHALRTIALAVKSHVERRPLSWSDQAAVSDVSFQFT